jgi:hypothetical protein
MYGSGATDATVTDGCARCSVEQILPRIPLTQREPVGDLTGVSFGKLPATIVSEPFASPSGPITVVAPPSTKAGTVDITISTLGGELVSQPTSAKNGEATFTYHTSAPSAPQDLTAKAGKRSASASWKAPATDGGDAITKYIVKATSKGETTVKVTTKSTSATLSGLAAHKAYVITVLAVNAVGKGLPATTKVRPS